MAQPEFRGLAKPVGITFTTRPHGNQSIDTMLPGAHSNFPVQRICLGAKLCHGTEYSNLLTCTAGQHAERQNYYEQSPHGHLGFPAFFR